MFIFDHVRFGMRYNQIFALRRSALFPADVFRRGALITALVATFIVCIIVRISDGAFFALYTKMGLGGENILRFNPTYDDGGDVL